MVGLAGLFDKEDTVTADPREAIIKQFLAENDFQDWSRSHLTGDASTRAYELLRKENEADLILMNAPAMPDGPPIENGKSYSQIAHLAENVRAYVAMTHMLKSGGFRVPDIKASDLDKGLLVIEHLGSEGIVTPERKPIGDRYMASIETLARFHDRQWAPDIQYDEQHSYTLNPFDHDAIMVETDLLLQWYVAYRQNRSVTQGERDGFEEIWTSLVPRITGSEQTVMLRDYHSPNIIWKAQAEGIDRTALIDFQDALIGPTAYDVASIAQDARVDVSGALEDALLEHYLNQRPNIDDTAFREIYAILTAQRATKILGIFVRLSQRDHKHDYLAHLPRVESYLARSLRHPVLAPYANWLKSAVGFS